MWKKAFLAALLLAVIAALPGCGADQPPVAVDTTAADTTAPDTVAPETEPLSPTLRLDAAYTIVRPDNTSQMVSDSTLALNEALGGQSALATDWVKSGEEPTGQPCEILVGATNRPESAALGEGLGRYDYRVAVQGEKLVIAGGSDVAVLNAVAELIHSGVLAEGTIDRNYTLSFDGADSREDYIANPDGFLCNWALEFDVPDWLTDYKEKVAAWADPDGRMMSAIHRNDHIYYPENCIEGIISCIKMGVDSLELDVGITADGVVVLMHDSTLKRTTDWSEKAGKNGLPASNNLADWTLEQLRQLCLKTNAGVQTDYLIPTMEEVLTVCKGRIWLRLDKINLFDWNKDIQPLIEKTGAWDVCIFNREYALKDAREYRDIVQANGGIPLYYSTFSSGGWATRYKMLEGYGLYPIIWWSGFDKKNAKISAASNKTELESVKDVARVYVDAQSLGGATETPEVWNEMYRFGINFILVDEVMTVQKYIAEHYEPTPY